MPYCDQECFIPHINTVLKRDHTSRLSYDDLLALGDHVIRKDTRHFSQRELQLARSAQWLQTVGIYWVI